MKKEIEKYEIDFLLKRASEIRLYILDMITKAKSPPKTIIARREEVINTILNEIFL